MKIIAKTSLILLISLALVLPAWAHPGGPRKVVVVNPKHKPIYKAKHPKRYHRRGLPAGVTFAVIAGLTYAVIDNAYYRQKGDTYVYVEQPPVRAASTTVIYQNTAPAATTTTTTTTVQSPLIPPGSLVDYIPPNTTAVTVNGASFYVDGYVWYAPIAGSHQFVVVAPQL